MRYRRTNVEAAALRERIVTAWNVGDRMLWEIAAAEGTTVGNAISHLHAARDRGLTVRKGGRPPNPATTKLRNDVVRLFNNGNSQAEVGEMLGLSRGAVGRLIMEARALGIPVVSYTPSERARRARASERARLSDEAYAEKYSRQAALMRSALRVKRETVTG